MPVTISDVARLAGVSTATVSRALTRARPVGAEVASRVRRAADELGYSGNGIARALRRSRTDTVGMIIPSILNPFFASLVDSMEQALHGVGKQLLLCDSRQDPRVEDRHLQSLIDRQVDGIVVSPCHLQESVAAVSRAAAKVPLVQLDRRVDVPGNDWVGLDDFEGMRLVLEHLAASGTRSAAFVTSQMTNSSTAARLEGFRFHAERLAIDTRDEWIVLGDFSVESGDAAARQVLGGRVPPDAIVCAADLIAIGVLRACRDLGVSVPTDLQVTGFDDIQFAEYLVPRLTSLAQPTGRMALEVLRLLELRSTASQEEDLTGSRLAFGPKLVERDSTLPRSS